MNINEQFELQQQEIAALKESLSQTVEYCQIYGNESFVMFYDNGDRVVTFDDMMDNATNLIEDNNELHT